MHWPKLHPDCATDSLLDMLRRGAVTVLIATLLSALPTAVPAQAVVRIAAYNMKHGRGMDDVVDLPRIARVLIALDADVITLQEVDDRTERTHGIDQVAVLAELLGYQGVHGPHRPYQSGFYGNAILTRLPIQTERTHAIPPASGSPLSVHEVQVRIEGSAAGVLSVVSVHLAGSEPERMAQADSVTSYFLRQVAPVVLAGDFNGRPGSPVLVRMEHDWTIAVKAGTRFTYPSNEPDREIDFVMVRPSDEVDVLSHTVIRESMASDHRPILVELRIR
jgi:endonuclease/exonuclease/phosphatase family metal-dependent hydrolase